MEDRHQRTQWRATSRFHWVAMGVAMVAMALMVLQPITGRDSRHLHLMGKDHCDRPIGSCILVLMVPRVVPPLPSMDPRAKARARTTRAMSTSCRHRRALWAKAAENPQAQARANLRRRKRTSEAIPMVRLSCLDHHLHEEGGGPAGRGHEQSMP